MQRLGMAGVLFAVGLMFALATPSVFAQTQASDTFTLEPGGTATISFQAFCYEYGVDFPSGVKNPTGVADDNIRAALAYAVNEGLTSDANQALEVQYALWQLQGEEGLPSDGETTQAVVGEADATPPEPQATSLLEAVQNQQVNFTINSFSATGDPVELVAGTSDNFYGNGEITVENTSDQALTLYMPVGTVFPAEDDDEQDVVGYATNIAVNNPAPQPAPQSDQQQMPQTSGGIAGTDYMIMFTLIGLFFLTSGWFVRRIND